MELKAKQFYFVSLTLEFCDGTTQLSSSLFLEFVFVKSVLRVA